MNPKYTLPALLCAVALLPAFSVCHAQTAADSATTTDTKTAKLPRLLDLGATACIPCKMMKPVLDGLTKDYAGKMTVEFIDVWKSPELGKQYKVSIIPCQIFFSAEGKELYRHEGYYSRDDIMKKWKELGVNFPAPVAGKK